MNKSEMPEQENRDLAAKNQAEMIKKGAHIIEDGRLEATGDQVEAARMEMLVEQTTEKIREAIKELGPDVDNLIKYLQKKNNDLFLKVDRDNPERVDAVFLLQVLKESKEKMV